MVNNNFGDVIKKCISRIELICILTVCIALLISARNIISEYQEILLVAIYLFFCGFAVFTTYFNRAFLQKAKMRTRVIFVMAIAFIIRALVCYFLNISQQGDYAAYLSVADKISTGNFTPKIYYGIFPHALNYPIFVSGIYSLIGNFTWIPRLINLIFGVIGVGCIVGISEKSVNSSFGLMAGLAAALNPSIIIFTIFAGGEPVYDVLIMAALLCFVFTKRKTAGSNMIFAVFAGILSALGNFFRPTGIIFIIAALIVLLVYEKGKIKTRLILAASLVAVYFAFTIILGQITYSVSGYKNPSPSYGWNLFVGANEESSGRWNTSDAAIFNEKLKEYDDPSEIQTYFAGLGFNRYYEMKTGIPGHFINKLSKWFDESFIVNSVTNWQNEYTRFKSGGIAQTYNLICTFYNFFIVAGSIAAMVYLAYSKKSPPGLKAASLYMMGSIIIFMLLESTGRYKGAYYSMLTLLGSYGAFIIYHHVIKPRSGKSVQEPVNL